MEFLTENHNRNFDLKIEITDRSYCESKIPLEMWAFV